MKNHLKGIGQVFSFTLIQQIKTKTWRVTTILLAALFLILPAGIMTLVELLDDAGSMEPEPGIVTEDESFIMEPEMVPVETVYVVDQTGEGPVSFDVLNEMMPDETYTQIDYQVCGDDFDVAVQAANADPHSLILVMDRVDDEYRLSVLIPEGSELSDLEAYGFQGFLYSGFSMVLMEKSGIDAVQMVGAMQTTDLDMVTHSIDEEVEIEDDMEVFDMILSMVLSFFNIMLLYFLVLFYGQSVANSVIVEKTSKLMDTFLVSVKPGAMIFGKVFAIVTASAVQFILWIVSLIGSFAAGCWLVKMINPESDMLLLVLLDSLSIFEGMFSVPGIVLAVLMVLAGFLLYCALAAIGGSLAGKPEDLSSTNMLFTMILVISFLASMYAGGIEGLDMGFGTSGGEWLNWVPFTAILVAPAKIILGDMPLLAGTGSLAIVVLTAVLVLAAAGKVYRMMALFKGNPPSIIKMVQMLKEK